MVSIKDFAKKCGVSYEAVRKQIRRYEAELQGHIHKQGRTQYLDDVAVAFLMEHRAPAPPMAVYDQGVPETVQDLIDENAQLKDENSALKDRLLKSQDVIIGLQGNQARLEAAEAAQKRLETSNEELRLRVERSDQRAAEEAQRADQTAEENRDLRKRLEDSEAREKALKERSWWERLMRKGE